jgi:hypothetical protein
MLAWLVPAAFGAPLVPDFTGPHDWKVEVYWYEPATNPYSTDWVQTDMEVVAVSLACAPSGRPRTDHCRPIGDTAWWGFRPVGSADVALFELPNSLVLEIVYSDRGRIVRYDWLGDLLPFRTAACNALLHLDRTVNTEKRVCSADAVRTAGEHFQRFFAQSVLSALEVELPKGGDAAGKPWKVSEAPKAGTRYNPGALAATNGTWVETAPGEVAFNGQITERPVNAGSVGSAYATDTALTAKAHLDTGGRPTAFEAHAVASSTGILYGHSQTDTWLTTLDSPVPSPPERDPRSEPEVPSPK